MKYTVTIKDNTTGKILFDDQADCVIGALDMEDSIRMISLSDANMLDAMYCAIKAVEAADCVINNINRQTEGNNA